MFKSKSYTISSKTVPVQIITLSASAQSPTAAVIKLTSTAAAGVELGSSTTATCVFPLSKGEILNLTLTSYTTLYAKLASGTIAVKLFVLSN